MSAVTLTLNLFAALLFMGSTLAPLSAELQANRALDEVQKEVDRLFAAF
jgi:hypothetical protein